jgi:hypothetical protein
MLTLTNLIYLWTNQLQARARLALLGRVTLRLQNSMQVATRSFMMVHAAYQHQRTQAAGPPLEIPPCRQQTSSV